MQTPTTATLLRLSDTSWTVADPAEDRRGRRVVDHAGDEVGTVDDLLIDDRVRKARFRRLASGGILGIGETHVLVPVDAITRIESDTVRINQTRERLAGAPRYAPDLADRSYYEALYGYYGYGGYVYPPYPYC